MLNLAFFIILFAQLTDQYKKLTPNQESYNRLIEFRRFVHKPDYILEEPKTKPSNVRILTFAPNYNQKQTPNTRRNNADIKTKEPTKKEAINLNLKDYNKINNNKHLNNNNKNNIKSLNNNIAKHINKNQILFGNNKGTAFRTFELPDAKKKIIIIARSKKYDRQKRFHIVDNMNNKKIIDDDYSKEKVDFDDEIKVKEKEKQSESTEETYEDYDELYLQGNQISKFGETNIKKTKDNFDKNNDKYTSNSNEKDTKNWQHDDEDSKSDSDKSDSKSAEENNASEDYD